MKEPLLSYNYLTDSGNARPKLQEGDYQVQTGGLLQSYSLTDLRASYRHPVEHLIQFAVAPNHWQ